MQPETENSRIILGILESVDRDGARPQRGRASELGIALGLVNAYLKYCIRKGYLKARKIPARRYQYFLTPKGFAEKSRLALSRLSSSLEFVRAVRVEYANLFAADPAARWKSVVIAGTSTLAEICAICAMERAIRIVAIVDPNNGDQHMMGVPLCRSFSDISEPCDGAVVADLNEPGPALLSAELVFGPPRVVIPPFLRASLPKEESA